MNIEEFSKQNRLRKDIKHAINKHSIENGSNTPTNNYTNKV